MTIGAYFVHRSWRRYDFHDQEWPPPVSPEPAVFRWAAHRLHEKLTNPDWRPPRSRAQSEEAESVYRRLAAVRTDLAARGRAPLFRWLCGGYTADMAGYLGWFASIVALEVGAALVFTAAKTLVDFYSGGGTSCGGSPSCPNGRPRPNRWSPADDRENPLSDKIFVNYRQRRADGTLLPHVLLVETLADRLATHFDRDAVYLDTTLRPGEPYPDALRARVADAAVLVVVIHPGWLADLAARTDRRTDWVHEEIATAVARGTRLLPVVLDGAELPKHAALPPAIRALADAQAITLRFGSLADGLAAAIAEIELIVAPDVPAPVASVAPLPDRGRLAAVLVLFVACGLFTAFAAVTGTLGSPGLPPFLMAAVAAGVPLLYLVVILALTACMYTVRRPVAWVDERLVRTPHRAFVVFGFGVLVVAVCLVALMAVTASGLSADALLLTVAASTGILVVMGVIWLRNQEQTPGWPHAPARPTPIWVRKALVDLEHHLDSWQAPLPLRRQREALVALSAVRGALATMTSPASRTLLAWWRTRSPWITLPHSTLAGAAVALATTALALHWHAEGPGLTGVLWWLGAVLLAVGAYGGSLVFEHRRLQWQIRAVAKTIPARLAELEERLAALSRPGLIAVHHTRA